ncbi:N-acetyltransferase [Nocardiopsis sp. NRRL B-16309]|uniref:GNAT family N-acetyltransferase n=1 Tax=Nocardiopsis sp. NRRL B-16309 TaxID=1519494 RepID=UPI0006B0660E|nr:GNAT family N-acetyltransferase [Nocardiopsis sp. NRRL B-16309]KOX20840.1 GCN5 family acetyltransferase [Nocardiopsis sp. NRRL B-16309]
MPPTSTAEAVRTATMNDVPGVARVLGRAFANDPLPRWLFPDDDTRMARTVRLSAIVAGFGHVPRADASVVDAREGTTDASGATAAPVIRGAALWNPPEGGSEVTSFLVRSLPHLAALVGLRRVPEVVRYLGELAHSRPEEPHWYLSMLGTDPVARGTGVGSRLLRAGLARADADGVPVYLETMNSANLGYYEKFDFRVVRVLNDARYPSTYCLMRGSAA